MWVERVSARAFGPFRDAILELRPGLTVVVGPNEAGKSSWHAALRLALTGRRRGRGGRTVEDRELEERHRPWDEADGPWEVEARLHLDDGRVIEINQDLAGRVDCRAVDIGLGRDVSTEIIVDGSPDASRWLGLDRGAFAATVSVEQAGILAVVEAADGLQDDMQRAAATAGRDSTAAEAIARITDFRKSAVGADTRVAVGPLRQARQAVADGERVLADARARHLRDLGRAADAQVATWRVATARERLAQAEAAVEQSRAAELVSKARRAAELASRNTVPPPPLAAVEGETARVATALEAWRGRPATAVLDGPNSEAIAGQLSALPPAPLGDTTPHAMVLAALSALDQAEGAAAEFGRAGRPSGLRGSGERQLTIAGLATAAFGIGAILMGSPLAGLLLIAVGLGVAVWIAIRARTDGAAVVPGRSDQVVARLATAEETARQALRARGAVADGDVHAAFDAYLAACAHRAEEAAVAAQAEPLRRQLESRRQLEGTAAEVAAAIARAESELRAAAEHIGQPLNGDDPERLVGELEAWQRRRAADLEAGQRAIAEWQELNDLLGGQSLEELEADAAEATRRMAAAGLSTSVALPVGADAGLATAAAEEALAARRADLLTAERAAAALEGEARQIDASLPSVAEAEEAVGAANVELERVVGLAAVLDRTLALLRNAEEQVHRDLAPVLADSVQRWLPRINGGAYLDVSVDPRDLRVRVKEAASGQWRDAQRLSEGTREQIYLLLRVAMAQHLVTTGETAPLILDEVTAQADDARREALLEVLHELSRDRQVIVFTHDPRIGEWADHHLEPGRDIVISLPSRHAAAS
ncbi:MAG: ATP-binding protein [Candidatus Limnocylindria bacterium]